MLELSRTLAVQAESKSGIRWPTTEKAHLRKVNVNMSMTFLWFVLPRNRGLGNQSGK